MTTVIQRPAGSCPADALPAFACVIVLTASAAP